MSDETSLPPPQPGTAPAKKGLSPLAWIAIIVGGVVVLGMVGMVALGVFVFQRGREVVQEATGTESFSELAERLRDDPARVSAEMMVRANPELDLIETDDVAGTIAFLNNRTGEQATLNFADIAEGRFSMTTEAGDYTVDASADDIVDGGGGVTLTGPDGVTRFGATASLDDVPAWVPVYPAGGEPQSTYQTQTGDSLSGALSTKTSDDAQTVIAYYRKVLEDAGYSIGAESMTKTGDGAFGAITGERREEEQSINVTVVQDAGGTQIMVNYSGGR